MQVVNVDWVVLADAMYAILGLLHLTRSPQKLSKHDGRAGCQRKTMRRSCDAEQSDTYACVLLEHVHEPMTLSRLNAAIDTDEATAAA